MLAEAGVKTVSARLDLKNGIGKEGARITSIRMEDGRLFKGHYFIDAMYEGDLMAKAGVNYTVGREPNSLYNETANGIQGAGALEHRPAERIVDSFGKTDSNTTSGVSTDFVGMNYDYPEGDYAARERIARANENWQRGLLWTLQNHPRVPEAIRKQFAVWGLPKDEFADNGNWTPQLYVREARRMVGETVETERTLTNAAVRKRSIGMGIYTMDSHYVQRAVDTSGHFVNEGNLAVRPPKAYQIDYGAIIPKAGECENLLVPVAMSASHVAYGSIRMEPVFMILGQSAATAACLALETNCAVQTIDYELLRTRLLEDGQVLE